MPVLRIALLGGLSLTWNEVPLSPPSGSAACSLFAYLVTYRHRAHTRDLLAGTFWPDLTDTVARRRLSRALWEIRRALPPFDEAHDAEASLPPVLLTPGDCIQFNPQFPHWLDVEAFTESYSQWREGGPRALERGRQCVAWYRGEFLAGYYDDWLLVERERLHAMFLATLEHLVQSYKVRSQYGRALTHARRLATEVPWREETHREVMRLCHLLGRDNEALRQFQACRQILAEELDAEPSPETLALARQIETGHSADRDNPGHVPDLPKALPRPTAIFLETPEPLDLPLVGRERERAELLVHLEALFQGLGGVVMVEGHAGVGKTRLLQTLAHDAEWRGAEVLWGEAQEIEPATPYAPLVEALTGRLSSLRVSQLARLVDRIWLQALAILLSPLATGLPGLLSAPQLDPIQEQDRLVAALAELLAGWRQIKPLLVVLENLHWAGEDTLAILVRLAPALRERGVLLVGSYRGEDARALPGVWRRIEALDQAGLQHRLVLGGLDAAATSELVRRSLGLGTPAPLFERRLYRETKGNPLFILETLRALHGEGLLVRNANGQWGTPWDETTTDYAELPLPQAVEQTIARRLAFLTPALRQMVDLAAVLGERFDFELFLTASGKGSSTVLTALNALAQRRFLDETAQDYRFSHEKVRQVAYARIDPLQRTQLHRQAAQALETFQPGQAKILAHHWAQAAVWDKAAAYHRQAGDRARAVYANAEAVAHYDQALSALERSSGPLDLSATFELRMGREAVCALQGERATQAQELETLEGLAERLDDKRRQAEVALRRAAYAEASGDYHSAVAAVQAAVALASQARGEDHASLQQAAKGYQLWGRILWQQGEYESARSQLEQALRLARELADHQAASPVRAVEAAALDTLSAIHLYESDYDGATGYAHRALRAYRDLDDRRGEANSLAMLGLVARNRYDFDAAQEFWEQALEIGRQIGCRQRACIDHFNLAETLLRQQRYHEAEDHAHAALEIAREISARREEGYALGQLALIAGAWGDPTTAVAILDQVVDLFRQIDHPWGECVTLTWLCLYHHYRADDEVAEACGCKAVQIAQEQGSAMLESCALLFLGHVLTSLDRLVEATQVFHRSVDLYREVGDANWGVEASAGLARISRLRGEPSQARSTIDRILAYLKSHPLDSLREPLDVYLTCYRVLHAIPDARAREVLETAHALLVERADRIHDQERRRSFLEVVPAHRDLLAAYRQHVDPPGEQGQQVTLRLPRADAPLGRPLRDDEYVSVIWTVTASQDEAIAGKVARRRHRLVRLLAEAQAQEAAPTQGHLAQALGVSRRTIERDVAALRREGVDLPPTRGKMSE